MNINPHGNYSIPTKRLGEDYIGGFLFGQSAKLYGDVLSGAFGISDMPVNFVPMDYANSQERPFARQLYVAPLIPQVSVSEDNGIDFGRHLGNVDRTCWMRGIRYHRESSQSLALMGRIK
jgi:hypothetical protein